MNPSKLVFDIRESVHVKQRDLAHGLMDVSILSRFEAGVKELPYSVIEAMVERLGKSCDKFDLQIGTDEYKTFLMQQMLMHHLQADPARFEALCEAYEDTVDMTNILHQQYFLILKGCAAYLQHRDAPGGVNLLTEAVELTFQEWTEPSWDKYLLCAQELQALLLLSYFNMESDRIAEADELLERLQGIIDKITDEELRSRLYPQLCYLRADEFIRHGDRHRVIYYLREGIDCITENGILTLAKEYLELEIMVGENSENAVYMRDALRDALEMADIRQEDHLILQFLVLNQHREIIISNELLKDTRQFQNISQEALGWEICATETLSRIENGKRTPHKRNLDRLYQRLGLDEVPYRLMETDDFSVLEDDRLMRKAFSRKEYEIAVGILLHIKERLDASYVENRQYIRRNEIDIAVEMKQMKYEDAIEELDCLMKETFRGYTEGNVYRTPTRNEFQMLLQTVVYYNRMGLTERAVKIGMSIFDRYEQSIVCEEHHAREYMLLYINLPSIIQKINGHKAAEDFAKRGIHLAYNVRRGDVIGMIAAVQTFLYKSQKKKTKYRRMAKAAYWILVFYRHDKVADSIKNQYGIV